jgi:hypothetical protein
MSGLLTMRSRRGKSSSRTKGAGRKNMRSRVRTRREVAGDRGYFTSHARYVLLPAGLDTLRTAMAPGFMTSSPVTVRLAG